MPICIEIILYVQNWTNSEVISMLHSFMHSSFRLFHVNFCNVPEGIKLIESIYFKHNNYPLMDKVYEDDRTPTLVQVNGFRAVVPPKKIVNPIDSTINNFTGNEIPYI